MNVHFLVRSHNHVICHILTGIFIKVVFVVFLIKTLNY